ncbi:thioredoxin domain-containing protein [Arthrobacter sulfonylureivorans]|uniref:Thioredoxin domain-containing protein n=1 Tax=Arthrobacter sulfonylureivorans TaxID=2486855 RepID=A0ABY3W4B1_9MICC|nr:thioredoxin domain-containing protein [Arthrobacter sulfonylureivorans]UNK45029.1 thioredoxin domain-containing protein [Arthrobacter sulfonylureivorans]
MAGRLRSEASAYLRQHAGNPVDWWPFGDQAFEQARLRDVPVFVSVGYAACHWCHVMAGESFEDQATAEYLNEHFIPVKVDREERPDVDSIYMSATQLMTGQGGWPMSVFALPDGRAFYAGTYFPPRPQPGQPSFRQVLQAVHEAWEQRREAVETTAASVAQALAQAGEANRGLLGDLSVEPDGGQPLPPGGPAAEWGPVQVPSGEAGGTDHRAVLEEAVEVLSGQEDTVFGGFGGAPKFPPSAVLHFLLRHAGASRSDSAQRAAGLSARTLLAMAGSALYDQLEGGFARYTVDRRWSVPHFEKMLYDNVQLLRVYAQWAVQSPAGAERDLGCSVAAGTAGWLVERLQLSHGGIASSLDADTVVDGVHHEGATYLWSPAELRRVLGADDGDWVVSVMCVGERGNVTANRSTLHPGRPLDPDERLRWEGLRPALLAVRQQRAQPARDEKVVAGWNGLAVAGLAEAGELLGRPDLTAAAAAAADYLLSVHLDDSGRLARVSHDGAAQHFEGLLEDYAGCAEGLFSLYAATGEGRWYRAAEGLVLRAEAVFLRDGTLRDQAVPAAQVSAAAGAVPPADPLESATPSGTSLFAGVLATYAAYSGSVRHRELAGRLLGYLNRIAARAPRAAGWGLAAAQALAAGPVELAVTGQSAAATALIAAARASGSPGIVVARHTADPRREETAPLLADKPVPADGALAYVCRGMVCRRPVATAAALLEELGAAGN